MKLRVGFVTNSSSSSYLIMMKDEDYQTAFASIDENRQSVISEVFTAQKAFGMAMQVASWGHGMGGESSLDYISVPETLVDEEYGECLYIGDIIDEFVATANKVGADVYQNSTDI